MANTAQIITEISKITDKTVARFCLKTKTFFLNLCTKIKQWESFQLGTEKVEQSDHGSQSQWEFKVKISKLPKRGKTLLTKFRLVLLLRLIGWENSADFLDQLQSEVKRDQSNPRLFSTLNRKLLQRGTSYIVLTQSTIRTRSTDRFSLSSLAAIATLLK